MDGFIKTPLLIIGAIGGALSVLFGTDKPRTVKEYLKATLFVLAGAIITNFLTPLIIHLMPSLDGLEHAIAFVFGLFGIGVVKALFNLIELLQNDFFGTLKNIRNIFKG